jgi:hypothetical protein
VERTQHTSDEAFVRGRLTSLLRWRNALARACRSCRAEGVHVNAPSSREELRTEIRGHLQALRALRRIGGAL